ncbi:MAG TPA: serine--tRNA ligase [Candidatus Saccharimonadales bacterium]|nr:serine--tRNA ligase [Candidatus Saccharimonadales bacterium]
MLDIQFIRDNADFVKEKSAQKGYPVDIDRLLELDGQRRSKQTQIEELRRRRNEQAADLKQGKPTSEQIEAGKHLKEEIASREVEAKTIENEFLTLLKSVPNMPLAAVPVGSSEDDNTVIKTVGVPTLFDFTPKHHHEIAEPRDLIDKVRASKIAGSRFAYIKGDLALLQFAIVQFVFQTVTDETILERLIREHNLSVVAKPFTPILPPAVLRTEPYVASARLNAEEVTYRAGQPEDDLWLNASAEHTLCTMYWDEILPEEMLPIRYLGYSTSFRREAGTYGKDTDGIFRMHQFDKLEMEVFSTPETGIEEHELLVAIQEYLVQQLGLPYQLIQKCTFDIGKPNASGYDINTWFPGQNTYRETHTADYMADYQARDLKTRVRSHDGSLAFVHTNDATAFALGRIMAAIIENFQTHDGHVVIPEVLRPFMHGRSEI